MALPITRLNLTHRTTTSSVPFPSDLRDQQSFVIQSHLSLQNFEKPSRRESDSSTRPITRQPSTKRKAGVARHAIYIPTSVPGPLVGECNPPPLQRNTTDPIRCHTPFQTLSPTRPIIADVILQPTPPLRPSIRTYASSPSMTLRPQPPPFPHLNLHAKASHSADISLEQKNARKARRQCQYGYGYNPHLVSGLQPQHPRPHAPCEPIPRPVEHFAEESDSSNMGTPAAIYASESDSDSTSSFDRSFDQDLPCEFPKPPTNGVVWSGRGPRVESSPLFTEEETDAVKRFLRRRWGSGVDRARDKVPHAEGGRRVKEDWEEETDFSWEAESPKHAHTEEVNRSAVDPPVKSDDISRVPRSLKSEGVDRRDFVQGLACDSPSGFPGREPQGLSISHHPHAKPVHQHDTRKISNMKAAHKPDRTLTTSVPDFRETLPLRVHPKSPSALDRLEASIVQLQAHKPHGIPGSSGTQSKRESDRPKPVPFLHDFVSLEKSGRKNPLHRLQTSLPLAAVRCVSEGNPLTGSSSVPTSTTDPSPLATPFLHRTTWSPSQPPAVYDNPIPPIAKATQERGLKSFIDITPERELRLSSSGVHKERVRKLLARASSGVLGWGRSFTRKGSLAR